MKTSLSVLLLIGSVSAVSVSHHKHHHHHHVKNSNSDTYPAKDSHSKVVPYVVRDHAWNHNQYDHTHDTTWDEETKAQTHGAYSLGQRDEDLDEAEAEARADAKKAGTI